MPRKILVIDFQILIFYYLIIKVILNKNLPIRSHGQVLFKKIIKNMPGFNIPKEAFDASEKIDVNNTNESREGSNETKNSNTEEQMKKIDTEIDEAIKKKMGSKEIPSMSKYAGGLKEESIKETKNQGRGFMAALKENPTIARIVTSPAFLPGVTLASLGVAFLLNQTAHDSADHAAKQFMSEGNPFFDDYFTKFELSLNPELREDYGSMGTVVADSDKYLLSTAGIIGASITSLLAGGKSVLNSIRNRKERE
jgi:hypothetical protein